MRKILPFLFFALTGLLQAQIPSGYVQTTATVAVLAGGQFGASWTNLSNSPQLALLGCVSTFQTTVNGTFDAYGHISTLLADTSQICPSPSTWTFTFTFSCSVGSTPSSFQIQVAVTGGGGTEDISSQITAALPATTCSGGGGGSGNVSPGAAGQQTSYNVNGTLGTTYTTVSPGAGLQDCPGVNGSNSAAVNGANLVLCGNSGNQFKLQNVCQSGIIQLDRQIPFVSGSAFVGNSSALASGGVVCPTVVEFTGLSASTQGFVSNCGVDECTNVRIADMVIKAQTQETGSVAIQIGVAGNIANNKDFLSDLTFSGFEQWINCIGCGNQSWNDITGNAVTPNSTAYFLIDFSGDGSNDNTLLRIGSHGASGVLGLVRFQNDLNYQLTLADVNNFSNGVVTLGYYNGSSWTQFSQAEIWLGDTEQVECPLVTMGTGSQLALHWLGTQTTVTCASGPLLLQMNGAGYATIYNPPATIGSVAGPLITKSTATDQVHVVGGAFPPSVGNYNLGYLTQDYLGNQFFAGTPFDVVPNAGMPSAAIQNRARAYFQVSKQGIGTSDLLEIGYKNSSDVEVMSGNLLTAFSNPISLNDSTSGTQLQITQAGVGTSAPLLSVNCTNSSAVCYPLSAVNDTTTTGIPIFRMASGISGSTNYFGFYSNIENFLLPLQLLPYTPAVNGTNQNSPSLLLTGFGWDGTASRSAEITLYNALSNATPSPTSTLTFYPISVGALTPTYYVDFSLATGGTTVDHINVASARKGTFTCTGGGTITVGNGNEKATSDVVISLNAQGGTITTPPAMKTVTAGTGFSVLCGASDTSTYNYDILN